MQSNFNTHGIEALSAAIGDLPGALQSELDDAAEDIANQLVGEASKNAPVDVGDLANDISSVIEPIGIAIIRIKIGSNLGYAEPMEKGTDPFFPPVDELRRWAYRVLGDEDLAFIVARSISEEGLEAREYLADAFDDEFDFMVERTELAAQNAVEQVGLA